MKILNFMAQNTVFTVSANFFREVYRFTVAGKFSLVLNWQNSPT